ncbi:cytochrome P450 [Actinokineospora guangxiensis]|uniref:Cytochrome P450 n=1 Tax=Actinokineospora guangxiensis TaxID=1490288 RepID=A0ABW0EPN2_9PSEU
MPGPPPGPVGDRTTGTLAAFTADPLGFLTACAREHGDVVSIASRNVLLCAPEDIEQMLVDRTGDFAKTGGLTRGRRQGFPEAMMNSDGAVWRGKRDRLGPAFTRDLVTAAAALARAEAAAVDWPPGTAVDPAPAVARVTLRSVTRLLFGTALTDVDVAAVGRLVAEIMDLSVSPYALPEWLPTPRALRMRRALRGMDGVVARIGAGSSPVLSALGGAGAAELRDELATLVLSGFETTKNAVLWTLHHLATHPEHAERVAEDAGGAFTDAVVREAMRLHPPAWLTSREALRDVEFGGYHVPAGTTVTVSQWVTHRDPRWFPDADGFRPDRWLGPATRPRGSYFPFGLGPRACIGGAIAVAEATAVVAELGRRFHVRSAGPVRPRPALSLQPAGLRLLVSARAGTRTG